MRLGVALNDSPVGLAAYILEKFSTWTSTDYKNLPDGGLSKFNTDELLDNVMIYWITGSMTTSMRLYAEYASNKYQALPHKMYVPIYITVQYACFTSLFRVVKEISKMFVSYYTHTGPTLRFQQPVLFSRTRCR